MSLMLAEQTNQTVASSKLALDSITEQIEALKVKDAAELRVKAGTRTMNNVLQDKISGLPQLDVATVVAANGDVINFTRSFPAPSINLSDRDYFQVHRDNAHEAFFISTPVKNKSNGTWVFYLSRRLNDPSGHFIGLVIVGISVEKFKEFYERLGENLGEGAAVTLYRRDFTVFTRWPSADEAIGKRNLTGTSHYVVETLKKTDDVVYNEGPRFWQGDAAVSRLGAVRLLDRFPMIVNLTVTEDLFLSGWRHAKTLIIAVASGCVLALMIAAIFMLRIARQREKSTSLLRHLADQVPGALFQFQLFPDGRTIFPYANKHFRSQYNIADGMDVIAGDSIFSHQHPDDSTRIRESIQESARALSPWHSEYRLIFNEDAVVWRRGDASPEKLPDGSILWHGYIADITEEKNAEKVLHLAASVFSNAHDAIMIVALDGTIVDVNQAFTRLIPRPARNVSVAVIFSQPIHVGELVTFLASVNLTGHSSMEIGIKVMAQNIRSQESRHVNSCFFTMVAVDDERKPLKVLPLRPFSPDEKRRHAAALVRKEIRREFEQKTAMLIRTKNFE